MTDKSKPIILIAALPAEIWYPDDVIGYALAEDGDCIAQHLSSNTAFSKHDMGLTSDWKHDNYKGKYPEGYTLKWVDDPENDPEWQHRVKLNREHAQRAKTEDL